MNIVDRAVLDMLYSLQDLFNTNEDVYIAFSIALAGAFAMLHLGYIGLKMLAGQESLDVMSVMRPFVFGLLIFNWTSFTGGINNLFKELEKDSINQVEKMSNKINIKQETRNVKKAELKRAQTKIFASIVVDEKGLLNGAVEGITGISLANLAADAVMWKTLLDVKVKTIITDAIESVILACFSCMCYLIIFIKICFLYIMGVLGPIAFAFSILPKFGDAFVNWISRYISVCFYGVIGYTFVFLSLTMVSFALNEEIEALDNAVKQTKGIMTGSGTTIDAIIASLKISMMGVFNENIIYISCLLLGTCAMLTVPIISTWILQTSGAGQALGKMSQPIVAGAKSVGKAAAGGM